MLFGFASSSMVFVVSIIIGVLVCCIPIIGWILGPIIILSALITPFIGLGLGAAWGKASRQVSGFCPYCGGTVTEIVQKNNISGIDCTVCKNRIIVNGDDLLKAT